jgi:hypothetical protein
VPPALTRRSAVASSAVACLALSGTMLSLFGPASSPARAADEAGVARMQACTPTSADFVSLEVAPEVVGDLPIAAGMHRLWDLGVTWKDVNPSPGTFTWTALDTQVAKSEASGARPLLVLGMTPAWAAVNPNAGDPRWGLGTSSPPRNLDDWRAYVSAIVDRYGSRIAGYEIWNEANLATFWTGTAEQMADLTAAAHGIIKAKQPEAIVLLPSVTLRLRPSMRRFMNPFLVALGARGYPFDGFAIHTYPAGNLGPADRVNDIVYWQSTVVNQVGAASPILDRLVFDTEVNFGLAGPGATPGRAYSDAEGAALIQQTYLDSRNLGIDATFWYLYTAAPYSLLGVQLWQGAPAALDAWQATSRVFAAGTPCPAAGALNPFEVDRRLAPVTSALPTQAGKASVLDDATPATAVSPPTLAGSRLSITGGDWNLVASTSTTRTTSAFASAAGDSIAIQGSGYAPGSTVYTWLLSPATFLAKSTTDANGSYSTSVAIPSGTSAGTRVLQVNGFTTSGQVRSASMGLQVVASATSPATASVRFAPGKKRLDGSARDSLRDLVASLPTGVRAGTTITASIPSSEKRGPARSLARKRAKKVADFLRRAGLTGAVAIKTSRASGAKGADQVSVRIEWPTS